MIKSWLKYCEALSVCVHVCACVRHVFTTCIHVYGFVFISSTGTRSNICTHAVTLLTYARAYVCKLALKNLNSHYFDSFSPISLSKSNYHVLLSYFYKSCLLSQAMVVLATSLLGTGPWLMTQRPWCMQPTLSLSSVCFN